MQPVLPSYPSAALPIKRGIASLLIDCLEFVAAGADPPLLHINLLSRFLSIPQRVQQSKFSVACIPIGSTVATSDMDIQLPLLAVAPSLNQTLVSSKCGSVEASWMRSTLANGKCD